MTCHSTWRCTLYIKDSQQNTTILQYYASSHFFVIDWPTSWNKIIISDLTPPPLLLVFVAIIKLKLVWLWVFFKLIIDLCIMNLSFFNERFQQQTSVNVVSWHPIQLITPVVCKTCRVVCFWNIFYLVFFYTAIYLYLASKEYIPLHQRKTNTPPPPKVKKSNSLTHPFLP